jgi:hypothetical protein
MKMQKYQVGDTVYVTSPGIRYLSRKMYATGRIVHAKDGYGYLVDGEYITESPLQESILFATEEDVVASIDCNDRYGPNDLSKDWIVYERMVESGRDNTMS